MGHISSHEYSGNHGAYASRQTGVTTSHPGFMAADTIMESQPHYEVKTTLARHVGGMEGDDINDRQAYYNLTLVNTDRLRHPVQLPDLKKMSRGQGHKKSHGHGGHQACSNDAVSSHARHRGAAEETIMDTQAQYTMKTKHVQHNGGMKGDDILSSQARYHVTPVLARKNSW